MSSWEATFTDHAVWRTLEEVKAKLQEHDLPEGEAERDTVEYVQAVVSRVDTYREDADPVAFTDGMLSGVDGALRHMLGLYADWRNGGATDMNTVDASTVGVVDALAHWPSLTPKQTESAAKKSAAALSEATTEAIEAVTTKRDEMDTTLNTLHVQIAELTEQLEAVKTEASAQVEESRQKSADSLTAWAGDAEKAIGELTALRDEAQNMVHDTTAATVGAEYANYSEEKRKSARNYDIAAVIFGSVGLISLGVYLVEKGTSDSASLALTRIGITIGSAVIGGFLAARGSEQHKEAKAARRTSLALSRLGPFVANLPKEAREVLIIETADRIFTKGELTDVSERASVLSKLEDVKAKRHARERAGHDDEEAE